MVHSGKSVDPINETVGRRIRLKRQILGMSQATLGEKLGVSRIKIGKYESGISEVPASILFKLSRMFQVDACYFFDNEAEKQAFADLSEVDPILNKEALALLKDFSTIDNIEIQKSFASVMERAAELLAEKKSGPSTK